MSHAYEYVTKVALSVTPIFKFRYNTVDTNLLKAMPEYLKTMILSHQEDPNLKMLIELHRKIVELTGTNTYMENGKVVPKNKENFDWDTLRAEMEEIVTKYPAREPKPMTKERQKAPTSLGVPGALDPLTLRTELNSAKKSIDNNAKVIRELSTPSQELGMVQS